MDRTCGNCKHRGEEIEGTLDADYNEYGPTGFFLCGLIKTLKSHFYEHKGQGAVAKDASGYYAALCVESDFGCNRWEPKTIL